MDQSAVQLQHISKTFSSGRHTAAVAAVNDSDLSIQPGEFFTLLGPSGCGKTTTLRLIAGFETVTSGEILIQGRRMNDVPPHLRPVNTVFQNYALFPHLTVAQNVEFGLKAKHVRLSERERRVNQALELVRLPDLANRKPSQISGGQQQRVALARAIVNEPAVLLLDEPLGALDLKLRKAMQIELKHLQVQLGITFIYVTHDQEEALIMSDRIAVMNTGRILQVGDPVSIYEKPATRFVADFIGESNFLNGSVDEVRAGQVFVKLSDDVRLPCYVNGTTFHKGDSVTLAVRPEKVNLTHRNGHMANALVGTLSNAVYLGTDTRYTVGLPYDTTVVVRMQNRHDEPMDRFVVGDSVQISWEADDMRVLQE